MINKHKPRKLAHEILGLIAVSALVALVAFLVLTGLAMVALEEYVFQHDIILSEFDWIELDRLVFGTGAVLAIVIFSALFLAMLADRMAYIRTITAGIDALRRGEDTPIREQGNNELTQLAGAINYLSAHQKQVKQQETALQKEKEALIRSLSHDIRTPLTAIMTYAEYLSAHEQALSPEGKAQLELIGRKGQQIKELTSLLLDGSKQNLEHFADGRLLLAQLAEEFEEALEGFSLELYVADCPAFSGSFDVQQLRRIFDNLSSNIQKYADPAYPVKLTASVADHCLVLQQENTVNPTVTQDGYGIGLQSIRRIAQSYGGNVETNCENGRFFIKITLHL